MLILRFLVLATWVLVFISKVNIVELLEETNDFYFGHILMCL